MGDRRRKDPHVVGPGWDEGEVRNIYSGHHADLRTFYGRSAKAGQAVVKAFWY